LTQFSDVLLYTTPVATGYKLNNILPLAGMRVRPNNHSLTLTSLRPIPRGRGHVSRGYRGDGEQRRR